MNKAIQNAKDLIVQRARELAHLYAIINEWTALIATRRQLENERRVPHRKKRSVHYERMREMAMEEARTIECQEIPALVNLLERALENES